LAATAGGITPFEDCMTSDIPAGFKPLNFAIGFLENIGPLYGKWENEKLTMGFRVEMRHSNPGRVAHGGMLATFADMFVPIAARMQAKADIGFAPTISLNCDYLAPARIGSWVEGTAEALRKTKTLFFAQGIATSDGEICLRANAIFKVTEPMGLTMSPERLFSDFSQTRDVAG
jgi:uncharacterized protein (TIGR00369 family)